MKMLVFAVLCLSAGAAAAQTTPMAMPAAAPVCPRDAEPVPADFAAWTVRTPLTAARAAAALAGAAWVPGKAIDLALVATPAINYAVPPSRPGGAVTFGGMVQVKITSPGTYHVAIGSSAWLEMVQGKTVLDSVGHGHGPTCSGIRKVVDFKLQPGVYVLQIAGSGEARLPLLIARLP